MPPIPEPTPEEKKGGNKGKNKYISRCMESLKNENRKQNQKLAICESTFRESKKKSSGTFDRLETEKIEILD